jgi:hypothetical protein
LTEGDNEATEGLDDTIGAKEGLLDNDIVGTKETDGTSDGETPLGF